MKIVPKYIGHVSKTFQKDISSTTRDIPILVQFQSGSKPTNRLTDIQEIQNNFETVQKYPKNVSKKNQNDISSRTGNIPLFVYFQYGSKLTNRLIDLPEIQNYLDSL